MKVLMAKSQRSCGGHKTFKNKNALKCINPFFFFLRNLGMNCSTKSNSESIIWIWEESYSIKNDKASQWSYYIWLKNWIISHISTALVFHSVVGFRYKTLLYVFLWLCLKFLICTGCQTYKFYIKIKTVNGLN